MVSANYTEAMKAIIGCLIIENKTAPEILGTIHPFHFADDTLRQLYIKEASFTQRANWTGSSIC